MFRELMETIPITGRRPPSQSFVDTTRITSLLMLAIVFTYPTLITHLLHCSGLPSQLDLVRYHGLSLIRHVGHQQPHVFTHPQLIR